jgi:hypothetical protein
MSAVLGTDQQVRPRWSVTSRGYKIFPQVTEPTVYGKATDGSKARVVAVVAYQTVLKAFLNQSISRPTS